jgi:hypothetical protein
MIGPVRKITKRADLRRAAATGQVVGRLSWQVADRTAGSLSERYRVVVDRLHGVPYRYDLSDIAACPAS